MAKKNNITDAGLKRLCSFLVLAASQGQLINDTLQAQDKVFSSKHVTDLINSMSEQDKKYVDDIVANLNKLSSKTTNVIPDSSNAEPNTLYLYSADPNPTSYNQYMVLSDKTILDLGDTNISLEGYLKETDADSKYLKQVDAHTHSNKSTIDNLTQNVIDNINNLNIEVDGVSYTQDVDGKIALPNYPTIPNIATSINSSSVNTDTVSPKAVYDLIGGLNQVTDLDTFIGDTLLVGRGTGWNGECVNVPDGITCAFDVVYIPYSTSGNYGTQILTLVQSVGGLYSTFTRSRDNGTWKDWQRLCITKVADVAWTSSTLNDGMSGNMYYSVKNGICYVTVQSLSSAAMSTSYQTITDNLPAPEITGVWYTLASDDPTQGGLLVHINSTGKMISKVGLDNAVYYGTLSYPVK